MLPVLAEVVYQGPIEPLTLLLELLALVAPGIVGALVVRHLLGADQSPRFLALAAGLLLIFYITMFVTWLGLGLLGLPGKFSDHAVVLGGVLGFALPILYVAARKKATADVDPS